MEASASQHLVGHDHRSSRMTYPQHVTEHTSQNTRHKTHYRRLCVLAKGDCHKENDLFPGSSNVSKSNSLGNPLKRKNSSEDLGLQEDYIFWITSPDTPEHKGSVMKLVLPQFLHWERLRGCDHGSRWNNITCPKGRLSHSKSCISHFGNKKHSRALVQAVSESIIVSCPEFLVLWLSAILLGQSLCRHPYGLRVGTSPPVHMHCLGRSPGVS